VAYVGYLRHDRAWIYDSFHDDEGRLFFTSASDVCRR
jgi:hypothetical protein